MKINDLALTFLITRKYGDAYLDLPVTWVACDVGSSSLILDATAAAVNTSRKMTPMLPIWLRGCTVVSQASLKILEGWFIVPV